MPFPAQRIDGALFGHSYENAMQHKPRGQSPVPVYPRHGQVIHVPVSRLENLAALAGKVGSQSRDFR